MMMFLGFFFVIGGKLFGNKSAANVVPRVFRQYNACLELLVAICLNRLKSNLQMR